MKQTIHFSFLLALIFSVIASSPAFAQTSNDEQVSPKPPADAKGDYEAALDEERREAKNAVYLSATSMLLATSGSITYERALLEYFGISVGLGMHSNVFGINDEYVVSYSGEVMFNFMTPGEHKFVGGVGVSVFFNQPSGIILDEDALFAPAAHLAYRYQPKTTGFFAEAGAGFHHNVPGVTASLGVAF